MCGIAGIFNARSGGTPATETLESMADAMWHRGPDDGGVHVSGACGFAFRRLAIIDLHTGHQPMVSADGRRAIVFNGEIYNYRALRERCENRGRRFLTDSDTETILALYELEGPACVNSLRGMFAFAIHDADAHSLFLARDRLGIKPLYIHQQDGDLAFASEIKALRTVKGLRFSADAAAFDDYFALRYVPAPRTIWREVQKLPPGHTLLIRRGEAPKIQRYWQLRFDATQAPNETEAIELVRAKLDECVRTHLVSDVPLGAFLSGGVDSAAVVSSMTSLGHRPLTCTIGSASQAHDERSDARRVAEWCRTDHREEIASPDVLRDLDRIAWHCDEPLADASALPTLMVSCMARKHMTVALSGDGGDECFAGYERRYLFEQREQRARDLIPPWIRRGLLGPLGSIWPRGSWLPRPLRAGTVLRNLAAEPAEAFFNTMAPRLAHGHSRLLHRQVLAEVRDHEPVDLFRKLMSECKDLDPVSRAQYVDFHTFLADDVLAKVDRMSMAASLEVRVPLLDHEFVELACRLPVSMKLRGRTGKWIFREAIRERVPAETMTGKKRGFEVPIAEWFRHSARKELTERLLTPRAATKDLLDRKYMERLHQEHLAGYQDHSTQLYTALMLQLWADKHHA